MRCASARRALLQILSVYLSLSIREQRGNSRSWQAMLAVGHIAQYREASKARRPEEFMAKIDSCSQEADETQFWLEFLVGITPGHMWRLKSSNRSALEGKR